MLHGKSWIKIFRLIQLISRELLDFANERDSQEISICPVPVTIQ